MRIEGHVALPKMRKIESTIHPTFVDVYGSAIGRVPALVFF
jgi:hypothetical protein